MTERTETRQGLTGGSQEVSATSGATTSSLPQATDRAQQQGLFPTDDHLPVARPVVVMTSGRIEYAARCPECRCWHRHVSLGEKDAPCGAHYLLQPKAKLKGAA